jgi:hypothetical protein
MQYRDRANYLAVQQLALHLEYAQTIIFNPDEDLQAQEDNVREWNHGISRGSGILYLGDRFCQLTCWLLQYSETSILSRQKKPMAPLCVRSVLNADQHRSSQYSMIVCGR